MWPTDQPVPCSREPELWFSTNKQDVRIAQQICGTCPVRATCLESALETERLMGEPVLGVHGGFTPAQRQEIALKQSA